MWKVASQEKFQNAVKLVDLFTSPNLAVANTDIKSGQLKLLCCTLFQYIKPECTSPKAVFAGGSDNIMWLHSFVPSFDDSKEGDKDKGSPFCCPAWFVTQKDGDKVNMNCEWHSVAGMEIPYLVNIKDLAKGDELVRPNGATSPKWVSTKLKKVEEAESKKRKAEAAALESLQEKKEKKEKKDDKEKEKDKEKDKGKGKGKGQTKTRGK